MLLASGAVLHTAVATTQEPGRVYRVGIMAIIRREEGNWPASFDELARLGFVEGQNLRIEGRFSMPNEDAPEVAAALAGMALDAILTGGAWDTRAAQKATRTIPIQTVSDDVLQEGLVESLAHPGGNTTGMSILATELDGKRQELLTDLVPPRAKSRRWPLPALPRPSSCEPWRTPRASTASNCRFTLPQSPKRSFRRSRRREVRAPKPSMCWRQHY